MKTLPIKFLIVFILLVLTTLGFSADNSYFTVIDTEKGDFSNGPLLSFLGDGNNRLNFLTLFNGEFPAYPQFGSNICGRSFSAIDKDIKTLSIWCLPEVDDQVLVNGLYSMENGKQVIYITYLTVGSGTNADNAAFVSKLSGSAEVIWSNLASSKSGVEIGPNICWHKKDNTLLVVWEGYGADGTQRGIYGKIFNKNGSIFKDEFIIASLEDNAELYNFKLVYLESKVHLITLADVTAELEGTVEFSYTNIELILDYNPINMVTTIDAGRITAVWETENENDKNIIAEGFDLNGKIITDEYKVNPDNIVDCQNPDVASDREGNIVITYQGKETSGTEQNAFFDVFFELSASNGEIIQKTERVNLRDKNKDHYNPQAITQTEADLFYFVVTWETKSNSDPSSSAIVGKYFFTEETNDQIQLDLSIKPEQESYSEGDSFKVLLDLKAPTESKIKNFYFVLLNETTGTYYFAPKWKTKISPLLKNVTLPANMNLEDYELLEVNLPSNNPPINASGDYTLIVLLMAEDRTMHYEVYFKVE